jgi:V/A-type H+-transporting ATPase subunit E
MSLAEIKKKIETEARTEADAILAEARAEADRIKKEAEKEIKSIEGTYGERFSSEQPEILRRRKIVASLDVNRIELGIKQQAISDSFKGAVNQLAGLSKDKYLSLAEKLLLKSVESGDEAVLVNPEEKHITAEWLSGFNEKHGKKLTLGEKRIKASGGFVLKSGNIETNCTWEMLVRWIRDDLEAEVAKRLFSA